MKEADNESEGQQQGLWGADREGVASVEWKAIT